MEFMIEREHIDAVLHAIGVLIAEQGQCANTFHRGSGADNEEVLETLYCLAGGLDGLLTGELDALTLESA